MTAGWWRRLLRRTREMHPPCARAGVEDPELTEEAARLLRGIGEEELAGRVKVAWYPRLRSTAGMAALAEGMVYLNPLLREFDPGETSRTLRHELAHLVAARRADGCPIAPHGKEWRQACRDLGIPGETATHRLPLPRRRLPRRFCYVCPSCGAELARARPLQRAAACRFCCKAHNGGDYHPAFRLQRTEK